MGTRFASMLNYFFQICGRIHFQNIRKLQTDCSLSFVVLRLYYDYYVC